MRRSVVVLGGYGNFGARVVSALAHEPNTRVYIAGRDARQAEALAKKVGNAEPLIVDHRSDEFVARLRKLGPQVLVHTAGPFQGQGYDVARACITAGCHYVDIADGREYVTHIDKLDAAARKNKVLIVAGASSLPALSSAVVDRYAQDFSRLDSIEHSISSGAKPPGVATMRGVLGYVGKPFKRWQCGVWRNVYGWQDVTRIRFPREVRARWLVNCDVPDLELFPQRYPTVKSVIFKAGIGFATTTLALWALSWFVRARIMSSASRYAETLHQMALLVEPFGTQWSAMRVRLEGVDKNDRSAQKTWWLLAGSNHGPNIPCFPAIALTRKLLRDEISVCGAMPCVGLLTVEEILEAIPGLDLQVLE